MQPFVEEAGALITAQEATRRVLVLENPTLRGKSRITQSLYAGLQLIMPGEIAPPHRHTSAAIRFILDGEGAYTQVEGEKTIMRPGDFVITPSETAHDHGNESKKPMIWLDVLDLPTVNFFETGFYQHIEAEKQNTRREHGDSLERYGSGVLPDGTDMSMTRSPIINYPYAKMRPILERLARTGDVDPHHGARFRYANPVNGGWVDADHGRASRAAAEGLQGQGLPLDRRHHLRLRRGQGLDQGRRPGAGMGPARRVRDPAVEALCAHGRRTSPCCSASPIARCRNRSASGARSDEGLPLSPLAGRGWRAIASRVIARVQRSTLHER